MNRIDVIHFSPLKMNSGHNSSVPLAHEQALFLYKQCDFSNCLIVLPLYPANPQSETLPDTRNTEVDQTRTNEQDFVPRDSRARSPVPVATNSIASNETGIKSPQHDHLGPSDSGKARRKHRAQSKTSCCAMVGTLKPNEARREQIRKLESKRIEWRQKAEMEKYEF